MLALRYLVVCLFLLSGPLFGQSRSAAKWVVLPPRKGLQQPVEVIRDRWGVNHIYAKNEHDLFYAQGYLAAKDRLFQFEMWRRQATGTVAELLGPQELKRDIGTRLFRFRGDINQELLHYHPHGPQIVGAFVEGINAYVAEILKTPEKLTLTAYMAGQPLLFALREDTEALNQVIYAGEYVVKKPTIWRRIRNLFRR